MDGLRAVNEGLRADKEGIKADNADLRMLVGDLKSIIRQLRSDTNTEEIITTRPPADGDELGEYAALPNVGTISKEDDQSLC